jgi:GT2 family glycosyltransferase
VHCAPGRARQMNAGAKNAFGGILLFLHADARLPKGACAQIRQALANPGTCAGAFRLQTDYDALGRNRPWVAPFLRLADMRSRYTSLPYGDQAPFVRATTFHSLGGFRDLPLFEDLEFARRLARRGRWAKARGAVRVSGRRFQERPFYYLGLMNTFPLLYRLGVSPHRLAAFYHQTR